VTGNAGLLEYHLEQHCLPPLTQSLIQSDPIGESLPTDYCYHGLVRLFLLVLVCQVPSHYGYRACSVTSFSWDTWVVLRVGRSGLVVYNPDVMAVRLALCSAGCWLGFVAFPTTISLIVCHWVELGVYILSHFSLGGLAGSMAGVAVV